MRTSSLANHGDPGCCHLEPRQDVASSNELRHRLFEFFGALPRVATKKKKRKEKSADRHIFIVRYPVVLKPS